ncbi:MAG: MutS-related protein [Gammaproteobacteria bacterium]
MTSTILQTWGKDWPEIRSCKPAETGEGVIDESTFRTIEVDELFDSVNHAKTIVGQSVLYRSLTWPSDSLEGIRDKQGAVSELKNNPGLKAKLSDVIEETAGKEIKLYQLLYGRFLGMFGHPREQSDVAGFGYDSYIKTTRFILDLVGKFKNLDLPDNGYLKNIYENIKTFEESRIYALMEGPVYKTESGIQSKKDRSSPFFPPALIFKPNLFKPLFLAVVFALIWVVSEINPLQASEIPRFSFSPVFVFFVLPLGLLYIPLVGGFDRDNCIYPLRDEFRESTEFQLLMESLGLLDELLAFIEFEETFGGETTLPEFIDAGHHRFNLQDARNPVLAKANPDYVANSLALEEDKLVLITGPNSGGKTAFCKTLTQIQLLAQAGCFVPAKKAVLTVADRIFYQVPEISHLDDGEGRFGTELKRTKKIFLAATKKSLVVLDELSEGTTFEEKLETSANILTGFYKKGNSTVLITHNHQLVDNFVAMGTGLARQVEFAHNEPTYRLVEGISRVSHAARVAKKIGFSKEDIEDYLANEQ